MANRLVTKALGGLEDLLFGVGTVVQARYGGNQTITKLNASNIAYDAASSIRTKLATKVQVLTNVAAMKALDTTNEAEIYVYLLGYTTAGDSGGGLFWLDASDTSSAEDLSLIFTPDVAANGRWKRIDTSNQLSPDRGDANYTILAYDPGIQVFATPLTVNRTVNLPTTGLFNGREIRVARFDTAGFSLNVGGIKTIPSGESAVLTLLYNGTVWKLVQYAVLVAGSVTASQNISAGLSAIVYPDYTKGILELEEQSILPYWRNEWPKVYQSNLDEVLSAYTGDDLIQYEGISEVTAQTYAGQSFITSAACSLKEVWVTLAKIGNPTSNLRLYIYSNSGGLPSSIITNGTATARDGMTFSSAIMGHKFVFPTNPTLLANTKYHIVLASSASASSANFWNWIVGISPSNGDNKGFSKGNASPSFSAGPTNVTALFKLISDNEVLQSGGLFSDGRLVCNQNSQLNLSPAWKKKNLTTIKNNRNTLYAAGNAFTANKTITETLLALDNNRFCLRCSSGGFAEVILYENDGTKSTVTGTTDITSGNHVLAGYYTSNNDGTDELRLSVDGTEEGTSLTAKSFNMSSRLPLGMTTFGGGFDAPPTWTQNLDMSVLPSSAGWTFNGGSESAKMAVYNNALFQSSAGYASTNTGNYSKTVTLNNSTGWAIEVEVEINKLFDTNTVKLDIKDGAENLALTFNESSVIATSLNTAKIQHDFTVKTNVLVLGKGSDYFVLLNGDLVIDGTNALILTTGTNKISFGDLDSTAGVNDDVIWHNLKYFQGSVLPVFTSAEISEFAIWNNDVFSSLASLYNSGSIKSVRDTVSLSNNYVEDSNLITRNIVETEIKELARGEKNSPRIQRRSLIPSAGHKIFYDYGDGSDGVIAWSGTASKAPGMYQATTFSVSSGAVITMTMAGIWVIVATKSITITGTLDVDLMGALGSLIADTPGFNGIYGGSGGGAGSSNSLGHGGSTIYADGGIGGTSGFSGADGSAQSSQIKSLLLAQVPLLNQSSTSEQIGSQFVGGGGGGASGSPRDGGNGGGVIILCAPIILVTSTGVITANGGVGEGGVGGGGGGGGGGAIIIASSPNGYTNSGSITAVGGIGGNSSGDDGGDGGTGFVEVITL